MAKPTAAIKPLAAKVDASAMSPLMPLAGRGSGPDGYAPGIVMRRVSRVAAS